MDRNIVETSVEINNNQPKLRRLWQKLTGQPKISISTPVDLETTGLLKEEDIDDIPVSGLEEGKLIVTKVSGGYNNQWETIHLLKLKKTGRLGVEYLNDESVLAVDFDEAPIVVYPDNASIKTLRIEKNPDSIKISKSNSRSDPALNEDGDESFLILRKDSTRFYNLDNKAFEEAIELDKEINGN